MGFSEVESKLIKLEEPSGTSLHWGLNGHAEKALQTRLVLKRNEIKFFDDRQLHCAAPINLRYRA